MKPKLSHKHLTSILGYDPATGIFTWLVAGGKRRQAGEPAGSMSNKGYERIQIDGVSHQAHRLAWFYVTGEWPGILDHKNGVKIDNRFCNLREATPSQNAMNRRVSLANKSGAKGVSLDKSTGRWRALVYANYRKHSLGCFETIEEAAAVAAAERHKLHGAFATSR